MAVGYNPRIVTNGLVLCLDAGNTRSYPGSGTTWTNLTNNAVTTISGTTSFSTGSLSFNGTNTFAALSVSGLTTVATIEMLVKIKNHAVSDFGAAPVAWDAYSVWYGNTIATGAIGFNTSNGDLYGLSSSNVTNLGIINNWKHIIFEMRSDVSYTNNKIYVNGISQTLSQVTGTENASNRSLNSGSGGISGNIRADYKTNMDLSVFKIYNRVLTDAEIRQNFNATRGRYGI